MMRRRLVWAGVDAPRMEIADAEVDGTSLRARGSQIGVAYELRYLLSGSTLQLELVRDARAEIDLGDADFFDLGYSPLFNSLPVLVHGLHRGGGARDFVMRWIDVPSLEAIRSEQRYEPVAPGVVRYRDASFSADVEFDTDGFVTRYPGLAERVS